MTPPKKLGHLATSLLTAAAFYECWEVLPPLVGAAIVAEDPAPTTPINIDFNANADRSTVVFTNRDQTDAPVGDGHTIVGLDERLPILSRQFPWLAIGRLEWQSQGQIISTCTATLIDSDALLTNSHCLTLPKQDTPSGYAFVNASLYNNFLQAGEAAPKLVFKPSMINGVSLDEATVVTYKTGWSDDATSSAEDWAVLRLDQGLGNRLGWRSLNMSNSNTLNTLSENILLAGYLGDFPSTALREFGEPSDTAGVELQCSVLGILAEGELAETVVHDCDTNPGASGAPMLAQFADGSYYIVSLHSQQRPLRQSVTLPNGVETKIVNGGVQVSIWARAASQMLSAGR